MTPVGELIVATALMSIAGWSVIASSNILMKAIKTNFIVGRGVVYNRYTQNKRFYFVVSVHVFYICIMMLTLFASISILRKAFS